MITMTTIFSGEGQADSSLPDPGFSQVIPMNEFEEVYALVSHRENVKALGILYELLDDALIAGQFEHCDRMLMNLRIDRLNPACWLGVLGIIAPAKSDLPCWKDLCDKIKTEMVNKKIPAQTRGALENLML